MKSERISPFWVGGYRPFSAGDKVIFINTCCLLSIFYIKPQHITLILLLFQVVFYLYSTSNHNFCMVPCFFALLSFIYILHQTTTTPTTTGEGYSLSFIYILHQTTTQCIEFLVISRCLLSIFYIKPQQ